MSTSRQLVLDFIAKRRGVQFIADATGWTRRDVVNLAAENGYRVTEDGRIVGGPQEPTKAVPQPDVVQEGLTHPAKRVQAAAKRAQTALQRLADLLTEDAGKAEARAEVDRLTAALTEARAKLRGEKPARSSSNGHGQVDAKAVRAWARENNVDCPANGRVPKAVTNAYLAAGAA